MILVHALTHLTDAVLQLTPSPSPSSTNLTDIGPVMPDFGGKFARLLSWTLWGCTLLCGVGIARVGVQMALSIRRGESSEHAMHLGVAFAGTVLVGSATTIAAVLLS